ncbi:MAG TPA: SDR family oxidoreductase [Solirubrobacteraceae bacterium]|jgi:NAD(P)-dependent dehydrogenase (short-subunit alcohol dehydrogenase family)|nr:SDR family oxidoreductase [Solirubrobacteraceae bacterium]
MPLALVTGASTGIGRATALRLVANGWMVLAGVRDPGAGEALSELADTRGAGALTPLTLDVTDPQQVAAAAEHVARAAGRSGAANGAGGSGPGRLDALVNNAGIGVGGPLELVSAEDLRRQFEVNVFAQVAVTQALLPALRGARTNGGARRAGADTGGRIVFVSSIGGRVAMAFTAPYAASKHAIEALADALRVELRTSGVRVALVEPGSVATPIWDKARGETDGLSVPPELEAEYGHAKVAMAKALEGTARRGVPAESVAETIERALTARRMRARYVVGSDARAMLVAKRLLPDLMFDRLARRALGV